MIIKKSQLSAILLFLLLAQTSMVPYVFVLSNTLPNNSLGSLNKVELNSVDQIIDLEGGQQNNELIKLLDNNINDELTKFDFSLTEYLNNIKLAGSAENDYIKVIILFSEDIEKARRNQVLAEQFPSFKILDNYDIIPGMYISIKSEYLIDSQDTLANCFEIEKIYKSETYDFPLTESSSVSNSLKKDNYLNWWIKAVGANNLQYDGTGVKVAVIDSGIYDHPDLNVINNSNFVTNETTTEDLNGHGTHVAGIIASSGESSGSQYRGIAPGVLLVNARAGGESGGLDEGDVVSAIEWCTYDAKVDIISMSFGGGYPEAGDPITLAASNAVEDGVMCVASAGNSGPDYFTGSSPAAATDVIAVGATDSADELAFFSSRGPTFSYVGYPDVVAPGFYIISTAAQNAVLTREEEFLGDYFDFGGNAEYIPLSGTSMSCPVVSGALAILKQAYPTITPETGRIALMEGAVALTDPTDAELVNSGAGLINVPNSLDYLSNQNQDVNDIATFFPNHLPVSPYDFITFPGDRQKFEIMVISGKANSFTVQVPSINGISISVDNPTLTFNDPGIKLLSVELELNNEIAIGTKQFQIKLVKGGLTYDTINISLNVKLPSHRILMESFHGLNDWFAPELSYNQLGFYDAMEDLTGTHDIAIDYLMEYWSPDYDKNWDNSILTDEKLAQYDLVVLQNPILPFNDIEISALKDYFNNGGDILFLGTRYQDLNVNNLNNLFAELNTGIKIEEVNLMDTNWVGVGLNLTSHSITNFNDSAIFNNVDEFYWMAGNSFETTGNAKSIATYNEKTVTALYDGTSVGAGKFIAFGDLSWMYSGYNSVEFQQNHHTLLSNLIDYYFNTSDISLNLQLKTYLTSSDPLELSVFVTDKQGTSITSASLNSGLVATVTNGGFADSLTMSSTIDGIAVSNSYVLPTPDPEPYTIEVSLTIGTETYTKSTKVLYYSSSKIPQINSIGITESATRDRKPIDIIANLDDGNYLVNGYLTFYSYSFYNEKGTNSKQISFSNANNKYSANYLLTPTDTPGFGIAYIVPEETNEGYLNPFSPRIYSYILNYNPEINIKDSSFSFGNTGEIKFEDTFDNTSINVYPASQYTTFNFKVSAEEPVNFESDNKGLKVSVNLFLASISKDGFLSLLISESLPNAELMYDDTSNLHLGSLVIPETMDFNTIEGTKAISTVTSNSNDYIGLLMISVRDTEGGFSTDPFIIVISIEQGISPITTLTIVLIVLGILGVTIIFIVLRSIRKKRKIRGTPPFSYRTPSETTSGIGQLKQPESVLKEAYYCPHCGQLISTPKKFCPNCGKSLKFFENQ